MSNSFSELRKDGDKQKAGDEGTHETLTTTIHKCGFCGKKFSSGKALGGHKRFHLQAQRKEKETNSSNGIIKLSSNNLTFDGKFTCSICGRDFPSNKSLYGHMRSHPDRNGKGIHSPLSSPPNHKRSSYSDLSMEEDKGYDYFNVVVAPDEEPAIGLSKHFPTQPRWPKINNKDGEQVYGEEEFIAAQILASLSHDTWPCAEYPELSQVERCVKKMKGASNSTTIEDIPSTSGVKCPDSHFDATKVSKKNNNKRIKLIVKLKNPYSEDEK